MGPERLLEMQAVASVLPFKTNSYITDELIDWDNVPSDPMFQLTFPQPGMLRDAQLSRMVDLLRAEAPKEEVDAAAREIQRSLNPHPSGQVELNTPMLDGKPLPGMQHKYRETVLFFPTQGQTCHAYCSYCFRWPQFVKLDDLKFASDEAQDLVGYLRAHPEVTDVIFTGGDPMIMRTNVLQRYIEPLLDPEFSHVNIRIGTKAPAYWPQRFTQDRDADDLLRLLEDVVDADRQLALMVHYSHPRELQTEAARDALRRILSTGATVRCQAPLIRHVNDDSDAWAEMIRMEVRLGAIPYYMFVERDTGARHYFEVPLARALEIFDGAYRQVSGLGRTIRGPVMSAAPGKILVDGITEFGGERHFVLKMLQGRDPQWVNQLFFAKYDEKVAWYDGLQPSAGRSEFFFEGKSAKRVDLEARDRESAHASDLLARTQSA